MEELFEKYWRGRLSESETTEFTDRLGSDQEFAEAFRIYELSAEASRRLAVQDLKKAMVAEPVKQKNRSIKWWMAAAVLLPLVIAGYFFLKPTSPQQLFAEHFSIPEISQARNDVNDAPFSALVNEGNSADVLEYISNMPPEEKTNYYSLYEGICLLDQAQPDQARSIFERIINSGDTRFVEDAQWYLLLAGMQAEDVEVIERALGAIEEAPNHPRRAQAHKIRRKLRLK